MRGEERREERERGSDRQVTRRLGVAVGGERVARHEPLLPRVPAAQRARHAAHDGVAVLLQLRCEQPQKRAVAAAVAAALVAAIAALFAIVAALFAATAAARLLHVPTSPPLLRLHAGMHVVHQPLDAGEAVLVPREAPARLVEPRRRICDQRAVEGTVVPHQRIEHRRRLRRARDRLGVTLEGEDGGVLGPVVVRLAGGGAANLGAEPAVGGAARLRASRKEAGEGASPRADEEARHGQFEKSPPASIGCARRSGHAAPRAPPPRAAGTRAGTGR